MVGATLTVPRVVVSAFKGFPGLSTMGANGAGSSKTRVGNVPAEGLLASRDTDQDRCRFMVCGAAVMVEVEPRRLSGG